MRMNKRETMNIFSSRTAFVEDDKVMLLSKEWADTVMDMPDWEIHDVDRPYVKALLVQAQMLEQPLKDLSVAIEHPKENYKICISGYSQMHSFRLVYRIFLDPERRSNMLGQVEDVYWQPATEGPGIIVTFIVRKTQFKTAQKTSDASTMRRFKKRE